MNTIPCFQKFSMFLIVCNHPATVHWTGNQDRFFKITVCNPRTRYSILNYASIELKACILELDRAEWFIFALSVQWVCFPLPPRIHNGSCTFTLMVSSWCANCAKSQSRYLVKPKFKTIHYPILLKAVPTDLDDLERGPGVPFYDSESLMPPRFSGHFLVQPLNVYASSMPLLGWLLLPHLLFETQHWKYLEL